MAQLELEHQKRRELKAGSGEVLVIRDLIASAETIEEAESLLEALKAAEIERFRKEGEIREIVFDEETMWAVATGVPRTLDDPGASKAAPDIESNMGEGGGTPLPEPIAPEAEAPRPSRSAPANVPRTYLRVLVENEPPPGRIEEAYYSVERGVLYVTGLDSNSLATRVLLADEDPGAITRSLLRERASGFNRPLTYPTSGLA